MKLPEYWDDVMPGDLLIGNGEIIFIISRFESRSSTAKRNGGILSLKFDCLCQFSQSMYGQEFVFDKLDVSAYEKVGHLQRFKLE